jgi:class III poly(R)-hydroxyalkanoic acid synthase PhaC subunit
MMNNDTSYNNAKYIEYMTSYFDFLSEYNKEIYNAFLKSWQFILNSNTIAFEPKNAQNIIRTKFNTVLQENLKLPMFVERLTNFIDADVELAKSLKLNVGYKAFADSYALWDKLVEPIRNSINRTPSEIIKMGGSFDLLHYRLAEKELKIKFKTPLLIVGSLINREHILDLLPQISIVRHFCERGFDVYATDWKTPSSISQNMDLETFAHEFLENAVEKIKEITDSQKVSLLGYCWGGIFTLIHATIHPENVKNLILHATPVDTENDTSVIGVWTRNIDVEKLVKVFDSIPPLYLNWAFLMRNPIEALLKYSTYFNQLRTMDEVNRFFNIESWLYDSPPIIGNVFLKITEDIYKNNLLIKNQMKVGENVIDLKKITMPLMNVMGQKDDLVPPQTSKSIINVISSNDKKEIIFPTGHVGLCISSNAHKKLWPQVSAWLAERS